MRNILILFFVLSACIFLLGCGSKESQNATDHSGPMGTVNEFIQVFYFNEGTYEDYVSLYSDPLAAYSEDNFNSCRRDNDPQEMLSAAGYESVEAVMNHLRLVEISDTVVEIHYVENANRYGPEGSNYFLSCYQSSNL